MIKNSNDFTSFEDFYKRNKERGEATLLKYYTGKVKFMKDAIKPFLPYRGGTSGSLVELWEAESILEILKKRHSLGHISASTTQPS